ncbi:MAG TPA: hypothetical protein VFG03_05800 [Telluria sp.]|nr:hypothetical protein [Telluria sp.]
MKALNSLILASPALIGAQTMAAEKPATTLVRDAFPTDVAGLVSAIEQAAK